MLLLLPLAILGVLPGSQSIECVFEVGDGRRTCTDGSEAVEALGFLATIGLGEAGESMSKMMEGEAECCAKKAQYGTIHRMCLPRQMCQMLEPVINGPCVGGICVCNNTAHCNGPEGDEQISAPTWIRHQWDSDSTETETATDGEEAPDTGILPWGVREVLETTQGLDGIFGRATTSRPSIERGNETALECHMEFGFMKGTCSDGSEMVRAMEAAAETYPSLGSLTRAMSGLLSGPAKCCGKITKFGRLYRMCITEQICEMVGSAMNGPCVNGMCVCDSDRCNGPAGEAGGREEDTTPGLEDFLPMMGSEKMETPPDRFYHKFGAETSPETSTPSTTTTTKVRTTVKAFEGLIEKLQRAPAPAHQRGPPSFTMGAASATWHRLALLLPMACFIKFLI